MKLKERPNDFQVTELLREGLLLERGPHRVYRVTKRKLTSIEAASELARRAGVLPGEVAMAGLKDRQGVTHQYMSVPGGDAVRLHGNDLSIQPAGALSRPISSEDSDGNGFKIIVRDLGDTELHRMRASLSAVREFGLPNYFDEQRFGNLRHGQGWIFVDLARGDVSEALKRLVASSSPHDKADMTRLKSALWRRWGDWKACREIAGQMGRHHSVFEHLKREPDDYIGGLHRVGSRERLIHLFAFQSHLWNRALSSWLGDHARDAFTLRGVEGKLVVPRGALDLPESWGGTLPLPGPRLEGVELPEQRAAFAAALRLHGLEPNQFVVEDVPGFHLAAEPRDAVVIPRELRMRPAQPDPLHRGRHMVELSFELPRGAYATLVVQRLVGPRPSHGPDEAELRSKRSGSDWGGQAPNRYASPRGDARGGPRGSYGGGRGDGYRGGQSDGYRGGQSDGYRSGQSYGYRGGQSDGYRSGQSDGYRSGQSDGYRSGQSDGYRSGQSDGYRGGQSDSYRSGQSDGDRGRDRRSETGRGDERDGGDGRRAAADGLEGAPRGTTRRGGFGGARGGARGFGGPRGRGPRRGGPRRGGSRGRSSR
ncbi:MAG: tRNA pseudouridine(13) synthase TruD [Planctomycetota bacterium]